MCDLGALSKVIGELVTERGFLADDDLPQALEGALGIPVPDRYRRLLNKFVWSAKGRGFIEQVDKGWVEGRKRPETIEELGGRTLDSLARRAESLVAGRLPEEAVFDTLLDEVQPTGRAGSLLRSVVGTAIRLAERRANAPSSTR